MTKFNFLITLFYKSMFRNKGVEYEGKRFPLRKVAGLRRYDVGNLLFISQNPSKKTVWAKMARQGKKIMWVIDTKFNRYLVRVVDGKITRLKSASEGEQ